MKDDVRPYRLEHLLNPSPIANVSKDHLVIGYKTAVTQA